MRILIAGTGGVGGYYGARLAAGGHDVECLARGPMLEALRTNGLELGADLGDLRLEHVHATDRVDHDVPAEAVLFVVKSYDNNEAFLMERFPRATVLGGTSRIEAFVAEPGVIEQRGRQSEVTLGAFTVDERPAAAHLGAAFDKAGVPVTLAADIHSALWQKLVVISGLGGITAYARSGIGEVLADEGLRTLFRSLLEETEAVARAQAIAVPDGIADVVFAYASSSLDPSFLSSMARDVLRGRPLEVEPLNGAVVRAGEAT